MAKQTFTTGQVLTAAQMTDLQQTAMGGGSATAKTASYVLVAADAGTVIQMNSASSTTITVNTALFAAGDSVQIQNIGAGTCTITAGTATVTTSASLALAQWEGGTLYFTSTSAAIFLKAAGAAASSALTISQIGTGTFSSGTSFTVSSLSSYDVITMTLSNVSVDTASSLLFRINNNATSKYVGGGWRSDLSRYDYQPTGNTGIYAGDTGVSSAFSSITLRLENCKASGFTSYFMTSITQSGTKMFQNIQGVYTVAEAVSSLVFTPSSGSFNASANYTIWGG